MTGTIRWMNNVQTEIVLGKVNEKRRKQKQFETEEGNNLKQI